MTSLHRRIHGVMTRDPENYGALHPVTLGIHFTTARPLEVRLRLPMGLFDPEHVRRGTYAAWCFDRLTFKASAMVWGGSFGLGDVKVGIGGTSWHAMLTRGPHRAVYSTSPAWIRQVVMDIDRLSPDHDPEVDVDPWIDALLGAGS